jgi:hypothetical protein
LSKIKVKILFIQNVSPVKDTKTGCTCADNVGLLVEHLQVEDVLRVDHLLPDCEGEPILTVRRVEDAGVVTYSEVRLDNALKENNIHTIYFYRRMNN